MIEFAITLFKNKALGELVVIREEGPYNPDRSPWFETYSYQDGSKSFYFGHTEWCWSPYPNAA